MRAGTVGSGLSSRKCQEALAPAAEAPVSGRRPSQPTGSTPQLDGASRCCLPLRPFPSSSGAPALWLHLEVTPSTSLGLKHNLSLPKGLCFPQSPLLGRVIFHTPDLQVFLMSQGCFCTTLFYPQGNSPALLSLVSLVTALHLPPLLTLSDLLPFPQMH